MHHNKKARREGLLKPYIFTDLTKLKPAIASVCTLSRKGAANEYEVPIKSKHLTVVSLKDLALDVFLNVLQDNPRQTIPVLVTIPSHFQQKLLALLAPDRVEVRVALHEFQFRHNNNFKLKGKKDEIHFISLREVIEAIVHFERRYLCYQRKMEIKPANTNTGEENPPNPPENYLKTLEPNLIDVWANYDTFKLRPYTYEESGIFNLFFGETRPYRPPSGSLDEPSVANRDTFMERFNVFTNEVFEGWEDWANMVVVGGSVQACLVEVPKEFSTKDGLFNWYHKKKYVQSDIDICFYGLDDKQFADKVYALYKYLENKLKQVLVIRTKYTVTLCTKWPTRHIQIVLAKWGSIQELIQESDVDCSAVAFDGSTVWTTQRGRLSYNYRCVIATQKSIESRGPPEYENRLMKFSRRGFYVWDMTFQWENLSKRYLRLGKLYLLEEDRTRQGATLYCTGLRLLLVGVEYGKALSIQSKKHPDNEKLRRASLMFVDKDTTFKNAGIAYGPKWSLERIRENVLQVKYAEDHKYGYIIDSKNVYGVVAEVRNQESIIVIAENAAQHGITTHGYIDEKEMEGKRDMVGPEPGRYYWWKAYDKLMMPSELGNDTRKWLGHILLEQDAKEIIDTEKAQASYMENDRNHIVASTCDHTTKWQYCIFPSNLDLNSTQRGYWTRVKYYCLPCFHDFEDKIRDDEFVYKIRDFAN